MNKILMIGLILTVVTVFLPACGVSQEDYNAVIDEKDSMQAEVETLKSELTAVRNELDSTKGDLDTKNIEIPSVQNRIDELEGDLKDAENQIANLKSNTTDAQNQLDTYKAELNTVWDSLRNKIMIQAGILNYLNSAMKLGYGELSMNEFMTDTATFTAVTGAQIGEIGDSKLSELWQNFFNFAGVENETEILHSVTTLTDRINELVNQDIDVLEGKMR